MAENKNQFLDITGLAYLWQHITAALGNKVSRVEGKGLSANDYTDEEKARVNSIPDEVARLDAAINAIPTALMANVKDYGAVGDGVTDDTEAIQLAIHENENVYFPNGTYLISAPIALQKNRMHVHCDGEIKADGCTAFKITGHGNTLYVRAIYSSTDWTGCGIQVGDTGYAPYYNMIDVGYISKMLTGVLFAPNGSGSGVAYTTVRFCEINATTGIHFAPGADEGSFINANTFIGGALSCSCPIKTEKGGATDPFNGNTFYNVALEWCDGGIELDWFQYNHFEHCRFSKWENYWNKLLTITESCEGNTFNWIGFVFVDQIDDNNTGIPNQYSGLLRYNDGTSEIDVGKYGYHYLRGMVVKERDRYYGYTTLPNQAEVDLTALPYAIEGHTFYANDLMTYMTLKLPAGYGGNLAENFYLYLGTDEGTVLVAQEISGSTSYLREIAEPGLYKFECNDAVGWRVNRVNLDTVAELANLSNKIADVSAKCDAMTDSKVDVEVRDGTTTNASLFPVGITSTATGTANLSLIRYTGFAFNTINGDETTRGVSQLVLGNNIPEGTTGNKQGQISLFSANGKASGRIVQDDREADSTQYLVHTLPSKSGTILNSNTYKEYVTPDSIGATPVGHIHSAINSDITGDGYTYNTTVCPMDDGQTPCISVEKNGQKQFAIRKDGNTIGYHYYEDGTWKGYDTIYSTANKPTAYDIQTGGAQGQLCAVNSDGSISPYEKTMADLYATDDDVNTLKSLVGDKAVWTRISETLGSYVVPVTLGGTGATDAATARSNLGAAASDHYHTEYAPNSHSHASVVSGLNVLYAMDNGDTPCIAVERSGQNQFALSRDNLANQELGYHVYNNGSWAAYHTLFSSANLSFSLNGTTLTITTS